MLGAPGLQSPKAIGLTVKKGSKNLFATTS
jgi:hypothetical protein